MHTNTSVAFKAALFSAIWQKKNLDNETMTTADNVGSQLIRGIFISIFIGLISKCDGQSSCGPGKVLDDEDFLLQLIHW